MANTICECGGFTLNVCPECKTVPLCPACRKTDEVCADCAGDEDEDELDENDEDEDGGDEDDDNEDED